MYNLYACLSDRRRMLSTLRRSKVCLFRIFVALCRYVTLTLRIVDFSGWDYYVCVHLLRDLLGMRTDSSHVGNLPSSSVFLRRTMRRTMCTSPTNFVSAVRSRAHCTVLDLQYIAAGLPSICARQLDRFNWGLGGCSASSLPLLRFLRGFMVALDSEGCLHKTPCSSYSWPGRIREDKRGQLPSAGVKSGPIFPGLLKFRPWRPVASTQDEEKYQQENEDKTTYLSPYVLQSTLLVNLLCVQASVAKWG